MQTLRTMRVKKTRKMVKRTMIRILKKIKNLELQLRRAVQKRKMALLRKREKKRTQRKMRRIQANTWMKKKCLMLQSIALSRWQRL